MQGMFLMKVMNAGNVSEEGNECRQLVHDIQARFLPNGTI